MVDKKKYSKNVIEILRLLDKEYGKEPVCFLKYKKDYELLFATIMAAQCKDDRVNDVTKVLFKKYKKLEDYANCDIKELEQDIKPVGFYKNKAKHIKACALQLITVYDKKVPSDIDELVKLSGVGRKTANVIRTHIYNIDSIVVDTHVKRVSKLLGLTNEIEPTKIELDLMKKLPKENWQRLNSQLMTLGRIYCKAQRPKCDKCFLKSKCKSSKKH